ncbi:hypothetical protein CCHL11_06920 [Colletotrichum chlorophyti]|uniref:DUF202 domain-containing protein n=1 Tax=Colletotrichum chlorophyti TaxID=708187 RepID=A0A1Q8RBP6_9PEZI|nr:hypothetical protein CCHL11_06920 [Colletotrichum chlorophyti]
MWARKPQSSRSAADTASQSPMQHRARKEDGQVGKNQPQAAKCHPKLAKDRTEGSATEASAQKPKLSSQQRTPVRFWNRHISVVVDLETCRDHLAYLRTGTVTAILGTIVAQLFALQPPDATFGYTTIGKPLTTVCYGFSICITILGACRTWRLQHAILRGKTLSGGFELTTVALGTLAVDCLTAIALVLGWYCSVSRLTSDG